MGTNNLSTIGASIVRAVGNQLDQYFTALTGVFVPRKADGTPETGTQDLGSTAYKWRNGYLDQINVDNIKIDGNTISSTDTDGDINITPDGAGQIVTPNGGLYFQNLTKIITNGTFAVPTGVKRIYVSAVGGGGGAAGVLAPNVHVEGGSASKGLTRVFDCETSEIATIDITLGAGGGGGGGGTVGGGPGSVVAGGKGGDTFLTFKKADTSTIATYKVEGGLGSATTTVGYNLARGRGYASNLGAGGNAATAEGNQGASGYGAGGSSNINTVGDGEPGGAGGAGAVYIYY